MKLIKSNYQILVDIILEAKQIVVVSSPNLGYPLSEALVSIYKKGIQVKVLIELTEQVYRAGYGEIGALDLIKKSGITILQKKNNNVSFIIIDSKGFFYFPKSSFDIEEGTYYDLAEMSSDQVKCVKALFDLCPDDIEDDIAEIIDPDVAYEISKNICSPDTRRLENLYEKIVNDPPPKPDFSRILNIYRNKFQFVELSLVGANIHKAKVRLPANALPIKDTDLKKDIEANLRLFEDLDKMDFIKPFNKLKHDLEEIRQKYLVHLKERGKSLIERERKNAFEVELNDLRKRIKNVQESIINNLQDEIHFAINRIKISLVEFFKENSADELEGFQGSTLNNEIEFLALRIINKIAFPKAQKMLSKLELNLYYFDITWEDLNNKKVIKELELKKLISKDEKAYFLDKVIATETFS